MPRPAASIAERRPTSRNLRVADTAVRRFCARTARCWPAAAAALVIAAGALLGFGVVLQRVVDYGLGTGSSARTQPGAGAVPGGGFGDGGVGRGARLPGHLDRRARGRRPAPGGVRARAAAWSPAVLRGTLTTGEVLSRLTTDTTRASRTRSAPASRMGAAQRGAVRRRPGDAGRSPARS
ncbi:MAG: hypothetical protein MZW92_38745 [Comamonadaceae bacterium]|nr:hypothetical protein [Comamonadaceae bacterium]